MTTVKSLGTVTATDATTVATPGGRPVDLPPEVSSLAPWVVAGVLDVPDVQVAAAVARLQPHVSALDHLAVALAARAPRYGHVCIGVEELTGRRTLVEGPLTIDPPWPDAATWRSQLPSSPVVAAPDQAGDEPFRPLVWDDDRLYLQRYWSYEVEVARVLATRAEADPGVVGSDGPPRLTVGGGHGAELGPVLDLLFGPEAGGDQRRAVERALSNRVSILAGGPGTGKTHTVARLLVAWWLLAGAPEDDRDRIALAAPTGKAAQRMGEAVELQLASLREAGIIPGGAGGPTVAPSTIHRLLGPVGRGRFRHGPENPFPAELVVIDETSMVSLPLMAHLIGALGPGARLVLVGDPFQLASIEAGSVMRDLVGPVTDAASPARDAVAREPESEPGPPRMVQGNLFDGATVAPGAAASERGYRDRNPGGAPTPPTHPAEPARSPLAGRVTVLSAVHRFDRESGIADLAEAVRIGSAGMAVDILRAGRPDVRWVDPSSAPDVGVVVGEAVAAGVLQVQAALDGRSVDALMAARSVKVLAATRRGPGSVAEWTARLEAGVADEVVEFRPGRLWHAGRPVMVTANDAGVGVNNGDTGVVVAGPSGLEVALETGGAPRTLGPSRLDQVETWWSMTIHKSQGSEYPCVVVSLPPAPSPILTRELLYTAVTRARERLVVVADEGSLRAAVARPLARASGLRERLWST